MRATFWICLLITAALFSGCVPREVEETIYLGDVTVKAPIVTPPLHLNIKSSPGEVTFSPKFTVTKSRNMLATSDEVFTGTVELPDGSVYRTKDKNVEWKYSRYLLGLDADLKVSRGLALFGGLSFSNDNYMGGNFGIGLFSSMSESIIRFDAGLTFQKYEYNAIAIIDKVTTDWWGNETKDRYIVQDAGEETNINPFFTLTFNSNYDSALVNYYLNVGYFIQQLLDYSPGTSSYHDPLYSTTTTSTDRRPDCSAGFLYINPGISLSLNSKGYWSARNS